MSTSPHPLTWPRRAMALAAGLVLCAPGRPALILLGVPLVSLGYAAWARETPLSRRWPRARRAQWGARFGLLAAALAALPHPAGALAATVSAGAAAGLLARETKMSATREPLVGLGLGAVIGLTTQLGPPRLALALTAVALLAASIATLAATFRGGPGRPPARPADVLWLYALGAALALALGLR